jgi:predicted aspartyl protease
MWGKPHDTRLQNAFEFSITGSRDGGVPSKITKPSMSPVYIQALVNNQPVQAIVDTGSAISIIHSKFLKNIQHNRLETTITNSQYSHKA